MAASFDTQLLHDVGSAIGTEMRAYNNEEQRIHNRSRCVIGARVFSTDLRLQYRSC